MIVFYAALCVAAYAFVLNRLAHYAQPMRLELADLCSELMHASDISDARKDSIKFVADNAFNPWIAPVFSVVAPFVLAYVLIFRTPSKDWEAMQKDPEDVQRIHEMIDTLFLRSIMVANPLIAPVFCLVLGLCVILAAIAGRTSRTLESVPQTMLAWVVNHRFVGRTA